MATTSEEVLESVNSEDTLDQGEAGSLKEMAAKDDQEDVEMSDCQSKNVEEVVEEGNVLASGDTGDVDMDGEATGQSENLLENGNALLVENDIVASKEKVDMADDDGGGGEQEEEPGLEEEAAADDGESQEDEEDEVDQGEEGEEGSLQKQTGEDVLKDSTNTAAEVKTGKLSSEHEDF